MKDINTQVANLILKLQGIDITKYDASYLGKAIQKRMLDTECKSVKDYLSQLEHKKNEANTLLALLPNSYTEFFRNSLTFAVMERIVIPALIQKKKESKKKEIRIWSAACASGQEPYSLAMLFEENILDQHKNINYRIFATDQDELQLKDAKKGKYTIEALGNMTQKRLKQWFVKQGETCCIKPELKQNIDFSIFDLFDEKLSSPPVSIFGDFDMVVCANLLFYYQAKYQKVILEKTISCLVDGGVLITGEAEREILMSYNYKEVYPHSAIFRV